MLVIFLFELRKSTKRYGIEGANSLVEFLFISVKFFLFSETHQSGKLPLQKRGIIKWMAALSKRWYKCFFQPVPLDCPYKSNPTSRSSSFLPDLFPHLSEFYPTAIVEQRKLVCNSDGFFPSNQFLVVFLTKVISCTKMRTSDITAKL